MHTVTLSPRFQVVIPREIREQLGLQPGQKFQAVRYGSHIELIPLRPMSELRGTLRGMDTTFEREDDRT